MRRELGILLKQFTAVDVVSRWSVPTIEGNATATLATKALDAIIELSPPSPKLNGRIEHASRIYRDQFYNCSDATPTNFNISTAQGVPLTS